MKHEPDRIKATMRKPLTDFNKLDFLATLGRELRTELDGVVEDPTGQDAYEIFSNVLGDQLSPVGLSSVSLERMEKLCVVANEHFETRAVLTAHMRAVVTQVVRNWSE